MYLASKIQSVVEPGWEERTHKASLANRFPNPTWYWYGSRSEGVVAKDAWAVAPEVVRGMFLALS